MGSKRVRASKKSDEDKDIISDLPEAIIGHILSFLLTKEAVSTCVLSKRWNNLWTFVTKLHFDDREQYRYRYNISKSRLVNSLYRVLLHLNTSSIQSFSLYLSENYDPYHVNRWVSAILHRRVNELYILSKKKVDILTHLLWKSQSLEKLVLNIKDCYIKLPTFVSLSSLTYLGLTDIMFTCKPSNDLQNLTLNFPVLREYRTCNCSWSDVKSVTLEVPMLEVLSIYHTQESTFGDSRTVIKFCAPRLTKFYYNGFAIPDTILFDFDLSTTCVAFADIQLYRSYFGEENDESAGLLASELLKNLNNNVKCLMFQRLEVLAFTDLPQFRVLTCLEIEKVSDFLLKAPLLKPLILKGLLNFDEELSNLENMPSCFKSNLQVLKFEGLKGKKHDLRFAKFVLENAQLLKKANFTTDWNLSGFKLKKVKEMMLSFKTSFGFTIELSVPVL
ncbi:F-box/FBD/LRR-repeat protein, partial [Mucuna pruriens]